ncbi:hypothetical protein [Corynebacterium pseudopelargi]|uniref:hypothetical protein n=1 Tax=Corynebacterium pseudopelargi TaxID=2080757 RepID=UPI000F4F4D86|nr:hypothetical protein [Corynebacterium pseudopelargi]
MTLTVSRSNGNVPGHQGRLGSRITQPAQVWDIPSIDSRPTSHSAGQIRTLAPVVHAPRRSQEMRTARAFPTSRSSSYSGNGVAATETSQGKESAKKFLMGSLLGLVMVFSVLGAAQGEEDTAPKDAQQVVASLEGDSR